MAMSGQRLAQFGCGDEDSGNMQQQFQAWAQAILEGQSQQTGNDAFVEPLEPLVTLEVSTFVSCMYLHASVCFEAGSAVFWQYANGMLVPVRARPEDHAGIARTNCSQLVNTIVENCSEGLPQQ